MRPRRIRHASTGPGGGQAPRRIGLRQVALEGPDVGDLGDGVGAEGCVADPSKNFLQMSYSEPFAAILTPSRESRTPKALPDGSARIASSAAFGLATSITWSHSPGPVRSVAVSSSVCPTTMSWLGDPTKLPLPQTLLSKHQLCVCCGVFFSSVHAHLCLMMCPLIHCHRCFGFRLRKQIDDACSLLLARSYRYESRHRRFSGSADLR